MGALTDHQKKQIIQKASFIQKFDQGANRNPYIPESNLLSELYEITDDLGIERRHVQEAFIEYSGVPIQNAVVLDKGNKKEAEIIGYAHGEVDFRLINELRAKIEYHFNTVGEITHRQSKIIWKAKPAGISKFINSVSSPIVGFESVEGNTRIIISQGLKTTNKLLIPGHAATLLVALLTYLLFADLGPQDAASIFSTFATIAATVINLKWVNQRLYQKKKNLVDLAETLQETISRRFKVSAISKKIESGITLDLDEPQPDTFENVVGAKGKLKE